MMPAETPGGAPEPVAVAEAAQRLRLLPGGPDRTTLPVVALDPGFLPTTRQMALAVADVLTDYYTPYVARHDHPLLSLPRVGRELERRLLPPELADKARALETGTEALRLTLSRAGVRRLDYGLLWKRNVGLDARVPPLLKAGATVIGQYGGCLETFKRARVLYGRTVLDYPISRVELGQDLMEEEARRRPDFADTIDGDGVRLAPAHLARIAAEVELADLIVVGSRFAAASFAGVVPPERIRVIPYGVDVRAFQPGARPGRPGPMRVLFAGHVTQRKGIAYLLDAMRLLDPARFALQIVGPVTGSGAGLRQYAGLFRHAAGVRPRGMPAVYAAADVLVLPSVNEGSALVVLEAMACGLPVIVTPNAGADAVRDGVDGFVVPVRSPEAIAERLAALQADPELARRMGASARARATEFTWERFRAEFRRAVGFPEIERAAPLREERSA
ncbi:MAG TPA: glycosyltransferase family 4 protein [Dehalococcoidia bacterium]|nr:glycosyltransferase family 4 protein [Dehalococcoidia bacterium]